MNFRYERKYTGKIQAVILDWAGTTVDYGCFSPTGVFLEVFKAEGIEVSMTEARGPMGMHKRDHIKTLLELPRIRQQWKQIKGSEWNEADLDRMFDSFVPKQIACLKDFSKLIPGVLEAQKFLREHNIKIGTTTGYNRAMTEVVMAEAKKQGYEPDFSVAADEVTQGRPSPFMIYKNMMELGIYPPESVIKVGDTVVDIEEGLNAGCWTVGVAKTGNLTGLSEKETENMDPRHLEQARDLLAKAGAHFVVDSIAELPFLVQQNLLKDSTK